MTRIDFTLQWHSLLDDLWIFPGFEHRFPDEDCGTPCTYTECILSVYLSGIPSVYVTGGYTYQRCCLLSSFS